MEKKLLIICEDLFALDIKMIVDSIEKYWKEMNWILPYHFYGYVCTQQSETKLSRILSPIVGTAETFYPKPNETFAMGIVNPQNKKKYAEIFKERGASFETLWAPWVLAPLSMSFGEGSIIAADSIIKSATIKSFVTLYHSMIGYRSVIDDYASVMGYANTTSAHIGEGAYIGANSAIMEDLYVGENAYVSPGSMVVRNVKSEIKVMGLPARRIKEEYGGLR